MKKLHQARDFLAGVLTTALVLSLAVPAGAALVGKTIQVSTGVDIYVDGVKLEPTDANGNRVETFVYNGTTYVPLRAVSQSMGKNVQYDGENQRVYIGEAPGAKQYLLTVCPPYELGSGVTMPATVTMGGNKYANGIKFPYTSAGYALFNLNGQYSTLDFDLGHLDGEGAFWTTLNIYLDGELSFSVDVAPEALPKHYTIPLHNALQMKIEFTDYVTRCGMAEIEVQ